MVITAAEMDRMAPYERSDRRRPPAEPRHAVRVVVVHARRIEVRAPDSIGLLHRVASALAEMGLDIRHATVQTIGPSVVDSFYVRTSEGAKVTDRYHRAEIERALLHAVGSPA